MEQGFGFLLRMNDSDLIVQNLIILKLGGSPRLQYWPALALWTGISLLSLCNRVWARESWSEDELVLNKVKERKKNQI